MDTYAIYVVALVKVLNVNSCLPPSCSFTAADLAEKPVFSLAHVQVFVPAFASEFLQPTWAAKASQLMTLSSTPSCVYIVQVLVLSVSRPLQQEVGILQSMLHTAGADATQQHKISIYSLNTQD